MILQSIRKVKIKNFDRLSSFCVIALPIYFVFFSFLFFQAKAEWEIEKQKAIKEAVKAATKEATESMEVDLENSRTEAKKEREEHEQEMEIIKTKHEEEIGQLKEEISQTKKRQWVGYLHSHFPHQGTMLNLSYYPTTLPPSCVIGMEPEI